MPPATRPRFNVAAAVAETETRALRQRAQQLADLAQRYRALHDQAAAKLAGDDSVFCGCNLCSALSAALGRQDG